MASPAPVARAPRPPSAPSMSCRTAHWDREWYLPFQTFRMRLVGPHRWADRPMEADPAAGGSPSTASSRPWTSADTQDADCSTDTTVEVEPVVTAPPVTRRRRSPRRRSLRRRSLRRRSLRRRSLLPVTAPPVSASPRTTPALTQSVADITNIPTLPSTGTVADGSTTAPPSDVARLLVVALGAFLATTRCPDAGTGAAPTEPANRRGVLELKERGSGFPALSLFVHRARVEVSRRRTEMIQTDPGMALAPPEGQSIKPGGGEMAV